MDQIDEVYYSLLGELVTPVPGVPDAFAEGEPCEKWYQEMYDAYERLRLRLNAGDEDPDVETIINSLLSIQHTLSRQMFRLGEQYGCRNPKDTPCAT